MDTSKDKSQLEPRAPSKKLVYVSNFRSSLTALVIAHHAATSYGGIGRNVYQSSFHTQGSSAALIGFNAINQSFFMGSFMYLGGYFSQRALERKSRTKFVRDRLYRLGLPSIVYTAIGAPICFAITRKYDGGQIGWQFWTDYWRSMNGVRGPLWFTATLFTFDITLAVFDWVREKVSHDESIKASSESMSSSNHVNGLRLITSLGLLSATEFLVRTLWPCGTIFTPLKLNIGYVTQYIAAYAFGAYARSVDFAIPSFETTAALVMLSGACSAWFGCAIADSPDWISEMRGGYNMVAASYAAWGNFTGYLLGTSLLAAFSKYSTKSWSGINDVAYSAFIVHIPIQTAIGCATDGMPGGAVSKTVTVSALTIVTSWVVGYVGNGLWKEITERVGSLKRKSA